MEQPVANFIDASYNGLAVAGGKFSFDNVRASYGSFVITPSADTLDSLYGDSIIVNATGYYSITFGGIASNGMYPVLCVTVNDSLVETLRVPRSLSGGPQPPPAITEFIIHMNADDIVQIANCAASSGRAQASIIIRQLH